MHNEITKHCVKEGEEREGEWEFNGEAGCELVQGTLYA